MRETKQSVLNEITDLLGKERTEVSTGSTIPSHIVREAANRVGVLFTSKPATCEAIIRKAGLGFDGSGFDSRRTPSGGGSTITLKGAQQLRDALEILLPRSA